MDWNKITKEVSKRILEYRKYNSKYEIIENSENLAKWEVERVITYLKDPNSPLSWFVGRTSDEVLIDLMESWIMSTFDDRKLFSQLNYKGMRYNYTPLMGETGTVEDFEQSQEIKENIKQIKYLYDNTEGRWNPTAYIEEVLKYIVSYRENDFSELVFKLRVTNSDVIFKNLCDEKEIAIRKKLESVNVKRVTEYIKFSEVVFYELLYKLLLSYKVNHIGKINLRSVHDELVCAKDLVMKYIYNNGKKHIQEILVNEDGKKSSVAGEFFTLAMQQRAYMEEIKAIEELLITDLNKMVDKECYYAVKKFRHNKISEYDNEKELLLDMIEGMKKSISSDDYKHLKLAKDYLAFCNMQGEKLGNEDDPLILRVIYREIIKNKAKLPRKNSCTALTIAKKRIANEMVENREIIFLECKIQRGLFREIGALQEYKDYISIMQLYRELMLYFAYFSSDIEMYNYIFLVLDKALCIVENCLE